MANKPTIYTFGSFCLVSSHLFMAANGGPLWTMHNATKCILKFNFEKYQTKIILTWTTNQTQRSVADRQLPAANGIWKTWNLPQSYSIQFQVVFSMFFLYVNWLFVVWVINAVASFPSLILIMISIDKFDVNS